jgi:hypothetical protein
MQKKLICGVIPFLLFILSSTAVCEENLVKYFSTGFLYSSGDANSKTYSIPLMLSWSYQRFNGSIATSYIKGNSNDSGLGDTTLSLGYDLNHNPDFSILLKEKFATCDRDKGLGTGKNDTSIQLDYFTLLNNKTTFIANIGYTITGKPDRQQPLGYGSGNGKNQTVKHSTMQNVSYVSMGISYQFFTITAVGLLLDYQQNTYSKQSDLSSLSLFLNQSLSPNWTLSVLAAHDNLHSNSLGFTLTTRF